MKRLFIVIAAVALIAAIIALIVARFRAPIRLSRCPPELVANGSFEDKTMTAKLVFLNDDNNCAPAGNGSCLDKWGIGLPTNLLAWGQSPLGISGVPDDPIDSPTDTRFINLSGQTNGTDFPSVEQKIMLVNGSYELRFKIGQGSDPRFGRTSPVSVDVAITGAVTGTFPSLFKTDANKGPWQDFSLRFSSNGGEITLKFSPSQHENDTMAFIGLDNVSLEQLKPVPDCTSN